MRFVMALNRVQRELAAKRINPVSNYNAHTGIICDTVLLLDMLLYRQKREIYNIHHKTTHNGCVYIKKRWGSDDSVVRLSSMSSSTRLYLRCASWVGYISQVSLCVCVCVPASLLKAQRAQHIRNITYNKLRFPLRKRNPAQATLYGRRRRQWMASAHANRDVFWRSKNRPKCSESIYHG